MADFSEAIKIDSNYKVAWLNRGATKVQTGDYKEALKDLDHTILLDSNLANAYYARGFAHEKLGNVDAACADFKTALRLGITSVQEKVDLCNGKIKGANNQKNIMVLTEEGDQQKLVALGPQLVVKVKDTLMAIVFFVMQSPTNTNVLGSLHPTLLSDSLSFIELLLANGETMRLNRVPHNQPLSKTEPLIFMALFDFEQNKLLAANNIQKISFHLKGDGYEYNLKDKYAAKLKGLLIGRISE
ncbi:MAG: tetratricopeptide repeat protein [Ginsengibacter sp.]